jgi:hypothetical protein
LNPSHCSCHAEDARAIASLALQADSSSSYSRLDALLANLNISFLRQVNAILPTVPHILIWVIMLVGIILFYWYHIYDTGTYILYSSVADLDPVLFLPQLIRDPDL